MTTTTSKSNVQVPDKKQRSELNDNAFLRLGKRTLPNALSDKCLQFLHLSDLVRMSLTARNGGGLNVVKHYMENAPVIHINKPVSSCNNTGNVSYGCELLLAHTRNLQKIEFGVDARYFVPSNSEWQWFASVIAQNRKTLKEIDDAHHSGCMSTLALSALVECPRLQKLDLLEYFNNMDTVAEAGFASLIRQVVSKCNKLHTVKLGNFSSPTASLAVLRASVPLLTDLQLNNINVDALRLLDKHTGLRSLVIKLDSWSEPIAHALVVSTARLPFLQSIVVKCLHQNIISPPPDLVWRLPNVTYLDINVRWLDENHDTICRFVAPKLTHLTWKVARHQLAQILEDCPLITKLNDVGPWDGEPPLDDETEERAARATQELINRGSCKGMVRFNTLCPMYSPVVEAMAVNWKYLNHLELVVGRGACSSLVRRMVVSLPLLTYLNLRYQPNIQDRTFVVNDTKQQTTETASAAPVAAGTPTAGDVVYYEHKSLEKLSSDFADKDTFSNLCLPKCTSVFLQTGEVVMDLADCLNACPNLEHLSVDDSLSVSISDSIMKADRTIRSIRLWNTAITDDCVRNLLRRVSITQELYCGGCPNITEASFIPFITFQAIPKKLVFTMPEHSLAFGVILEQILLLMIKNYQADSAPYSLRMGVIPSTVRVMMKSKFTEELENSILVVADQDTDNWVEGDVDDEQVAETEDDNDTG